LTVHSLKTDPDSKGLRHLRDLQQGEDMRFKIDPDSKGLRLVQLVDDFNFIRLKTDPDSKGLRPLIRLPCLAKFAFKNRP